MLVFRPPSQTLTRNFCLETRNLQLLSDNRQLATDNYTSAGPCTCSYGHGLPSKCASNSSRNFWIYEIIGIAAASPSGQKVRPNMLSARYFMLSMSLATPPPE